LVTDSNDIQETLKMTKYFELVIRILAIVVLFSLIFVIPGFFVGNIVDGLKYPYGELIMGATILLCAWIAYRIVWRLPLTNKSGPRAKGPTIK
jgi:hypothetical protein